ncbi:MAG: PLP-dependent aminotransferase family protein [Alphaproteobacteria bacterium]|nr:PLP-dependent aminotransferase family protein [Alphaproteobacteria bacterium]NNF24965.1 PLP-dependent aminotransferase family protein [Paracoccaceae bacterium]
MPIPVETFFLDPSFEGTLQQQIREFVAKGILDGRYRPGEQMPSSRKLAAHLGISRITVTLAYTDLVADDYLTSRGRSGYYVSENAPAAGRFEPPSARTSDTVDWARVLSHRISGGRHMQKPPNWRSFRYPFIYGQADESLFDHHNWRQCALRALGQRDFEALTTDYYERDDPKLVEFIARHSLPRRGIIARPEEILVTLGAQNALWTTAQLLLSQRRTAVLENPGYPGLREILAQSRCNVASVDVDEDGLPPDAIPQGADVVFVTPSHHCPTTATMPVERRRTLLKRAERDNFLVVEDDYEFEIAHQRPPTPALKSLDQSGRVIYIGSFSKSLFPGLRLGYVVGPEAFIREARSLRATVLRHPPGHIQRTAAYFLSVGHYDALVRRMAQVFTRRRAVMEAEIRRHGLNALATSASGGSSFWLKAPASVNTRELADLLAGKEVLIEPGAVFFADDAPPDRYFRLAYSSITADRIPEGIARVARAIDALR